MNHSEKGGLEIFAGAVAITAGVLLAPFIGPMSGILISAGAGMAMSGIGTMIAGNHLPGFATATRNPISPWTMYFGYCRPKGTLVYVNQWGSKNQMLDMVFVLGAQQSASVDKLLFDTQRVTMDPTAVPYPVGGGPGCARPTVGGTSYNPAQQVGNNSVKITSITRANDVVTVVLPSDIPYLDVGDRVAVLDYNGSTQIARYILGGTVIVADIVSRVPSGGTNILTFTYLSGGLPVSMASIGQVSTVWPQYGKCVYWEVLTGGQAIGETFNGMIAGTPWQSGIGHPFWSDPVSEGAGGAAWPGTPGSALVSPSLYNSGTAGAVMDWGGAPNPWTNFNSCAGKTTVFLRLTYGADSSGNPVFPSGMPQISFLSHGKNDIYDPRLGAYGANGSAGYTDNAVLCAADFLHAGAPKGAPWVLTSPPTAYAAGSLVSCLNVDYVSSVDGNISEPDATPTEWTPVYNPSLYVPSATYGNGDLVCYSPGTLYSASHTYVKWDAVYFAVPTYQTGNVNPNGLETYDCCQYVSLVSGNTGNSPATSPSQWMRYDGSLEYVSLAAGNTGNTPGSSPSKWRALPFLVVKAMPTGYSAPYVTPASDLDAQPNAINVPALITSANVCDVAIPLAAGGTEPTYCCDGQCDLGMLRGEILKNLLTACAGRLVFVNGQYTVQPGYWTPGYGSPPAGEVGTFDLIANAVGRSAWRPTVQIRELYNGVKGTYTSPANKWESSDFPAYCQDALHGYLGPAQYGGDINLAADGGKRRWLDVHLPYTTSCSMAQRIGKIELLRRRNQGTATFPCNLAAYRYVPLDIGTFRHAFLGWTDRTMEVQAVRFRVAEGEGGAPSLSTELDLQDTNSDIYAWSLEEELSAQGYVQGQWTTANTQEQVPFPWSPGYVAPYYGDALFTQGQCGSPVSSLCVGTFGLQPSNGTDAQNNGTSGLQIQGYVPVNDLDTGISGPFVRVQALSTGGSLPPGIYSVAVTAHDSGNPGYSDSGYLDFASAPVNIDPATNLPLTGAGNTGSIVVTIEWGSGDDGGDLYMAVKTGNPWLIGYLTGWGQYNAQYVWHFQQSLSATSSPLTTVTITSFTQATQGGVDTQFDHFGVQWQSLVHSGIFAAQVQAVTSNTVGLGGVAPTTTFPSGVTANMFAGRILTLLAKYDQTVEIPVLNMPILSHTAQDPTTYLYTLTIGPNSAGQQLPDLTTILAVGDLVSMGYDFTFTSLGCSDALMANPYYVNGNTDPDAGNIMVAMSGADTGDEQTVASTTATSFTLAGKWKQTPANGDMAIVVAPATVPELKSRSFVVPNGSALGPVTVASIPLQNLSASAWLIRVRTESAGGMYSLDFMAPKRMVYCFGVTNTLPLLQFNVPGTLAIQSNAAPLAVLPATIAPSSITVTVKAAATGSGAGIAVTIWQNLGGSPPNTLNWSVLLPAGQTSISMPWGSANFTDAYPAANAIVGGVPIGISITNVGGTYPGSDLSVILSR